MSDFDPAQTPDTTRSAEVAHTAQDKAAEGAGLVGEKAADVAGTAKDQAVNTAQEVATQARDLLGELREQLQGQSRAQAQQLAGNVRRLADELHEMSENGKPDSTATAVVRQVADSGRQVASHLENRGPEGVVEDLRDFARRRPGLFLAGAAVAGFAAARLGKGIAAAGSSNGQGAVAGTASRPRATGSAEALPQIAPQPRAAVPAAPVYPPAATPDQGRASYPEGN
ncbi:hypothetical protein [Actinacidiphila paucisporea]|uniref:DUF3618 domain-containing protein n=1 Tax=Actinacidiphila paucisporea TaxID=310782 RepID=A0A1M7LKW2_9ACTN|nr:hypothetical protein [Actinacidiphila paucisporea]SHM78289.1 hypothetical protein SAMN05216499_11476 [Actinacidiphila paucisporea]